MRDVFAEQLDTILQYAEAIGKIEGVLRRCQAAPFTTFGYLREHALANIRQAIDELNAQRAKTLEEAR